MSLTSKPSLNENYIKNQQFISNELEEFRLKFARLYNSPRLSKPAWLSIVNSRKIDDKLTTTTTNSVFIHLIDDFLYLYKRLNNFKQNNLFFNRLIGILLKYNLSWIYTVIPNDSTIETENLRLRKKVAQWTHILEKSYPYNPLWAQLGDLHGAVGHPLVLTRTVIVGENKELIVRLLFVLSYFIRCGLSCYYDVKQEDFDYETLKAVLSTPPSPTDIPSPLSNETKQPFKTQSSSDSQSDDLNQREINVFELCSSPMQEQPMPLLQSTDNFTNDHLSSPFRMKYSLFNEISTGNTATGHSSSRGIDAYAHEHQQATIFKDECDYDTKTTKLFKSITLDQIKFQDDCHDSHHQIERKYDSLNVSFNANSNNNNNGNGTCGDGGGDDETLADNATATILNGIKLCNRKIFDSNLKLINTKTTTKQRHISSNSLGENCDAQELPLIGLKLEKNNSKSGRLQDNFGYSLLAGYCDKFVFEFVLHGTSDKTFVENLHKNLLFSKENSILDCPIAESNYIVADIDSGEIKIYSSESQTPIIEPNVQIVDSMLKSVYESHQLFKSTDFTLLHLEDRLQELYFQAMSLYYLQIQEKNLSDTTMMQLLNIDKTDYELLNKIINIISLPNDVSFPLQ